jgi:hypothetical protein
MKRSDFESRLGPFGLNLSVYRNACYYAACEQWSLALGPYPAEEIKQAKLAISTPSATERAAIVNSFFEAAEVAKTSRIDAALDGQEFCEARGEKNITISWFDGELVVNVME